MRLLLFILLLLPSLRTAAQPIRQISSQEGLSNSAVLSLAQDRNGCLWLGTCDGLNQWNGRSMATYKASGNLVQQIIPTEDGKLWLRTNYGIDKFDINSKQAELHTEYPRVYVLTARSANEAFMIHNDQLYYYDGVCCEFRQTHFTEIPMNDVRMMLYTGDKLWFVSNSAISCVAVDYGTAPEFSNFREILSNSDIRFSTYDRKTIYYIGTHTLYALNTDTEQIDYLYDLDETIRTRGDVSAVVCDGNDPIVSFEMSGAVRLQSAPETAARYRIIPFEVSCGVFSLLKDCRQDIIWIGTDGSGLYQQTNFATAIRSVTFDRFPYKITKPVKALYVDREQSLWVGTKNDGIVRIKDIYSTREFTPANTERYTVDNSPMHKNSIYAFAPSFHDLLWIGGDGRGLNYYSYTDRRLHRIGDEYASLQNIHDLLETSDSTLWVATIGQGALRVTFDTHRKHPSITRVEQIDFGKELNDKNFFFALNRASDSILWLANHGAGAIRYNLQTERSEAIRFGDVNRLAANDVTAICKTAAGEIWFGTGCGLESYPIGKIAEENRMNNVIHSIEADSKGYLWLGTNTGMVKYDPRRGSKVVYNHAYGLDVIEFSDEASFRDPNRNTLYFGGINGFIEIDEAKFDQSQTYMPPLLLSEIGYNGKSCAATELIAKGVLTLHATHSIVTLTFTALDYINGSNYSYYYKLDNGDWTDNGRGTQLTLANLPYGKYMLAVRYHNNITGVDSEILTIPVRMLSPWYRSTVAYLLYILVFLSTAGWAIYYYVHRMRLKHTHRQLEYEQRQREVLHEARLVSLTNIAQDLSIPLTLIDAPCQQILNYVSTDPYIHRQAEIIQHNALKLNDLIHMLNELKESDSTRSGQSVELLNVSKLLSGIAKTFESYTEINAIDYTQEIEPNLSFPAPKSDLTMIVNILLNNAVKRTSNGGAIGLKAKRIENELAIEIFNRGMNFDEGLLDRLLDRYRMFDYFEQQSRNNISFKNELELAICGNLILKSGGSIAVCNDDAITTFTVTLPRLAVTKTTDEENPETTLPTHNYLPEPPVADISKYTLHDNALPTLIVQNDDYEILAFIADLFAADYNIVPLRDITKADEILVRLHPDIVICGSQALTSGIVNFIRRINNDRHTAQIPVVFLSATPKIETDIDSMELGVDICLTLPFNVKHMQTVVAQLLKKYRSLKDYGQSIRNSFDFTDGRILHRDDRAFLDKVFEIISTNILDTRLSTQYIADNMGMSLCNLYRRLGNITPHTPANIIKEYRLQLTEQLLITTKLSVEEIMYKAGFINRSTFFRCFTAKYGCTPKVYRQQKIDEALRENRSISD